MPGPRPDRWWAAYLKTALLLLPSILFFAVAVVFVFPKIKQMCADTNYDARYLFHPVERVIENGWLLLAGIAVLFSVFERWSVFWRRYRSAFLAMTIFLVHTAVLLCLVTSLTVMAMIGPALSQHL